MPKRPPREEGYQAHNIDARDSDSGWTALHFAARGGHNEFSNKLIGCGADVNALGSNNETPLHLAAGWGTKEMVGLLLGTGADKKMEWKGRTAEQVARENCRETSQRCSRDGWKWA